jgi:hypothetical protein
LTSIQEQSGNPMGVVPLTFPWLLPISWLLEGHSKWAIAHYEECGFSVLKLVPNSTSSSSSTSSCSPQESARKVLFLNLDEAPKINTRIRDQDQNVQTKRFRCRFILSMLWGSWKRWTIKPEDLRCWVKISRSSRCSNELI